MQEIYERITDVLQKSVSECAIYSHRAPDDPDIPCVVFEILKTNQPFMGGTFDIFGTLVVFIFGDQKKGARQLRIIEADIVDAINQKILDDTTTWTRINCLQQSTSPILDADYDTNYIMSVFSLKASRK
jgi:hypothetical protein